MQGHLSDEYGKSAERGAPRSDPDAHLLPAPHSAAELAAMEAAIASPVRMPSLTRTRVLVGTAALAVALTLPDISLGAIAAPYARIDLGEQNPPLPASVWTPSARPVGPAYAPVVAAGDVVPASMTFSSRTNYPSFERTMPVSILEAGSERFDLAFAGVALPGVEQVSLRPLALAPLAPSMPPRRQRPEAPALPAPSLTPAAPPPRAHLVAVPQITVSRGFRASPAPGISFRTSALTSEGSGDLGASASNGAIEAAFAGVIDASGAARDSIPLAPSRPAASPPVPRAAPVQTPTVRQPVARAIGSRVPEPRVGTGAAAEALLVPKTRLDARVNGVLTGSVDFRQLDGTIAIRLRSVVEMLQDRFSSSEIDHLRQGQAIDSFITLAELQAAGIPIRYNAAYDEVEFGIDYDDAPNAGKVQVEQIGAPTLGADRVGMEQLSIPFGN